MLIVAFRLKDSPLITVGDALESFLQRPDATTKGLCLLTREDVTKSRRVESSFKGPYWPLREDATMINGQTASLRSHRWSNAASGRRWSLTIGLIIAALATVLGLLILAIKTIKETSNTSVWSLGFGAVSAKALIDGWSIKHIKSASRQVLASILIANLPQTILSFLYLNLNGLLTNMWLASEWSDFARERKTLRVSSPKGSQRSNHLLQLPYKIGLPLMIICALLHWLVSQSIFLAVVSEYGPLGDLITPVAIATCGFSPIAMVIVLIAGTAIIAATIALGYRRYNPGIPLVGGCSGAISAACHRPDWDTNAYVSAVKWGAVSDVDAQTGVGHCCFSSGDVRLIQEGMMYAGNLKAI
jgi:hypothetical protein